MAVQDAQPDIGALLRAIADRRDLASPSLPGAPVEPEKSFAEEIREVEARREAQADDVAVAVVTKGRPKTKCSTVPWARDIIERKSSEQALREMIADPAKHETLIKQLEALRDIQSFPEFCRSAWHVIEPSTKLQWNWHHQLLACLLQGLFESWLDCKNGKDPLAVPAIRNCLINTPPGSLKPVHVDGLVCEKQQGHIRAGDVRVGDQLLTHRGRYRPVLRVASQGELPTLLLTTHKGRRIRAAGDHPVLTQRGWIRVDQLVVGDVLAEVHPVENGGAATVPVHEARLLGYLIGDGCMQNNAASFTNQDPESVADFIECVATVGLATTVRERPPSLRGPGRSTHVIGLRADKPRSRANNDVSMWLHKHALLGKNSHTKRVPACVMRGDREVVAEYLAAYWSCDGTISDRRDLPRAGRVNQTTTVRISATTVSEGLVRDHQFLLQKLGLSFTIRRKVTKLTAHMCGARGNRIGEDYVTWDLVASDQDTCAKFMDVIGPRMRHEKRRRAHGLQRTDFDRVLNADPVVQIENSDFGECVCFEIAEDSSFVYQGVAVHNSKIISVLFAAWVWLRAPGTKLICISVNDLSAQRDARTTRDLIESNWFKDRYHPNWSLKVDQDAVSNFGNTSGGERLSKPSGSTIVGLRGDCVAGETMVATEIGDVSIEDLHEMPLGTWPRVWSMNHETDTLELRNIQATRHTHSRDVVLIRSQTNEVLRCTRDHRIYAGEEYAPASSIAGREVSVLRRTNMPVQSRDTAALRELSIREPDLHSVSEDIHSSGSRTRQEGSEGRARTVLQQVVLDERHELRADHPAVRSLRSGLSSSVQEVDAAVLFADLSGGISASSNAREPGSSGLPRVPCVVHGVVRATDLLHAEVRRRRSLEAYAVGRELELLGSRPQVLRRILAQHVEVDPRARREALHSVWNVGELARDACTSRRRGHHEQQTGEPDHTLRCVPHDAPQVERTAVLSVDESVECSRGEAVAVYDIEVEGNHNFFAGGILVHNCLIGDDLNDPLAAEEEKDREKVNRLWSTNQYNRVNDPLRSLRICVQQRTHGEDHSGYALRTQGTWSPTNSNGWLHVVLPAEFDPQRKFVMPEPLVKVLRSKRLPEKVLQLEDPRQVTGQSIDLVRMPDSFLADERKRWEGTSNYTGQMLQSPALAEGGRIKRDYWGWFRLERGIRDDIDDIETGRPRPDKCHTGIFATIGGKLQTPGQWDFDWVVVSLDCAAKKTERGSNWGIVVMAGKEGRRYVLDDRTQRGDILEIIEILRGVIKMWRPDKILVEDKAAGDDLIRRLIAEMSKGDMPMIVVEPVKVGNLGKNVRLDACISVLANGLVSLLDGAPWLEAFVDELASFPFGARDDRVDCVTQVLNHYKDYEADDWPDM